MAEAKAARSEEPDGARATEPAEEPNDAATGTASGEPTETASGEVVPGVPCWADAMVPDLPAAKRFYGELFAWTFDEAGPATQGSYTVARLGRRRAAGLMRKTDGRMPTVWTVYLATPDAGATAERIRAAGGQVINEPRPVGTGPAGIMAVAADPGGAVFGLWQPADRSGFEVQEEPGAYVWAEVHTRDPADVDAFYPDVFGYRPLDPADVRDADGQGEEPEMVVWVPRSGPADESAAVTARCLLEEGTPPELPAHFLTYFAVEDCDAAAGTVERLGGRVRREPESGPYGRWAVCRDNQGATFAVLAPPERPAQ